MELLNQGFLPYLANRGPPAPNKPNTPAIEVKAAASKAGAQTRELGKKKQIFLVVLVEMTDKHRSQIRRLGQPPALLLVGAGINDSQGLVIDNDGMAVGITALTTSPQELNRAEIHDFRLIIMPRHSSPPTALSKGGF